MNDELTKTPTEYTAGPVYDYSRSYNGRIYHAPYWHGPLSLTLEYDDGSTEQATRERVLALKSKLPKKVFRAIMKDIEHNEKVLGVGKDGSK
jgi:hypothetical protein